MNEREIELVKPPTLTATGHGEVTAPPDHATVRLGAEAQAEDADAAQAAVNATMQKALKQIRKAGVAERSIQTLGLRLTPVYSSPKPGHESEPPRVVAYRAANTIQVQVDDLPLVGKVIDAGVQAGANRLEGVSFELKDDLPPRLRALRQAADEAKAKARAMAEALGVELVHVREATEGGVSIQPRQEMLAGAARAMGATATPVHPGELRIQATVTLRYEIGPAKAAGKAAGPGKE